MSAEIVAELQKLILLTEAMQKAALHGNIEKPSDLLGGDTLTASRFSRKGVPIPQDAGYAADTEIRFFGDSIVGTFAWATVPLVAGVDYPRQLNSFSLRTASTVNTILIALGSEGAVSLPADETITSAAAITDSGLNTTNWIAFGNATQTSGLDFARRYTNGSVIIPPNRPLIIFNLNATATFFGEIRMSKLEQ